MKTLAILLAVSALAAPALADEYVQGHYRKDGTYVQPHHRTTPDSNPYNNYGTQGNVNPYTGQQGTVNPYNQVQPIYAPPPVYRAPVCGVAANGQYLCR